MCMVEVLTISKGWISILVSKAPILLTFSCSRCACEKSHQAKHCCSYCNYNVGWGGLQVRPCVLLIGAGTSEYLMTLVGTRISHSIIQKTVKCCLDKGGFPELEPWFLWELWMLRKWPAQALDLQVQSRYTAVLLLDSISWKKNKKLI